MNFDNLSPELQNKVRECKTSEEIIKLAEEKGYELSDDELEAMTGGNEGWAKCNCVSRDCYDYSRL